MILTPRNSTILEIRFYPNKRMGRVYAEFTSKVTGRKHRASFVVFPLLFNNCRDEGCMIVARSTSRATGYETVSLDLRSWFVTLPVPPKFGGKHLEYEAKKYRECGSFLGYLTTQGRAAFGLV